MPPDRLQRLLPNRIEHEAALRRIEPIEQTFLGTSRLRSARSSPFASARRTEVSRPKRLPHRRWPTARFTYAFGVVR